jgi:hypothetical protein
MIFADQKGNYRKRNEKKKKERTKEVNEERTINIRNNIDTEKYKKRASQKIT